MKVFVIINFLSFVYTTIAYGISHSCADECNDCIASNVPKDKSGNKILSVSEGCQYSRTYTSFSITGASGYNGCGYQQDINNVFQICANECQTCQKNDLKCEGFTGKARSIVMCKPKNCGPKGNICTHDDHCCVGLTCLDRKCIDPKTDCTPCDQKIVPGKPCCNSSGIDRNGIWVCARGGACGGDTECGDGCCRSGSCLPRSRC